MGEEDWTYTGTFPLPTAALAVAKAELDFQGLDTVAEVVLNGVHIGSSTNMFVRCDIGAGVKPMTPVLAVCFSWLVWQG